MKYRAIDLKKKYDLANMEEVLAYCLECKISLSEVSFDTVKDISTINLNIVDALIKDSKDKKFSLETVFLIANKTNVPKNLNEIKPIQAIRMALLSNLSNEIIYESKSINFAIKDAFINSNTIIKQQYLPLLTGDSSVEELEKNAQRINEIILNMRKKEPQISNIIKEHIDKICFGSRVKNTRTELREKIWQKFTIPIKTSFSIK